MNAVTASGSNSTVRISGKNLGALALPDGCERCAWLKLHMRHRMPYGIFPGIFSSIDAFSKNLVHAHLDRHGCLPAWLASLGDVVNYIHPPHWSRFQMHDDASDTLLTGSPDAIFMLSTGELFIADYKTAKYTATQDALLPMYAVQLQVYAQIAEHLGLGTVAGLALVYTEPVTAISSGRRLHRNDGFVMPFSAHIVNVERAPKLLEPLLTRLRTLNDYAAPPLARAGCRDCEQVDKIIGLLAANQRGV